MVFESSLAFRIVVSFTSGRKPKAMGILYRYGNQEFGGGGRVVRLSGRYFAFCWKGDRLEVSAGGRAVEEYWVWVRSITGIEGIPIRIPLVDF